jgi:hypothetical protein
MIVININDGGNGIQRRMSIYLRINLFRLGVEWCSGWRGKDNFGQFGFIIRLFSDSYTE